jgi:RHS repeat-associated protein
MGRYRLNNATGKTISLNGVPYNDGSSLIDTDNPCEYADFHSSIIRDAKGQKIPFDDTANAQYELAKKECQTQQVREVFQTFNDPLVLPNDNAQFDGFPDNPNNDTPDELGTDTPQRNLIFGEPLENKTVDINIPPPQAPPAGEAELRANDEEQIKTTGADPVNLFTGEFYLEKVDFELPSIGFPFTFTRTYKSGRSFFGPFGYNWDHNFNVYLRVLKNGSIAVNTGILQEHIYTDSGDSVLYHSPRGVFAQLVRTRNADFTLTFKGGMKLYFEDSGFGRIPLIRIEDTNANAQKLIYDAENRLRTVVDTVGRKINFIYGDCGLLESLQPEFLQERGKLPVEIKYMHANNIEQLSAVITFPTSDFPNGLMTYYEYDEDQGLPELRNNIVRVIDAKGQTIVENIYGTDTTEDNFNRVVKQYFMGAEYLFKYTNIRFIPPFDEHINDAYLQTEFYEPDRPLKVLTFNFRGNLLDERFRLCADGSYRVWAQSYRYNKNGQMTEFYHPNGMVDVYQYYEHDPNDPLSVFERDGNLLKIVKLNTNRSNPRTIVEFSYDNAFQKVKSIKDESGSTTSFDYDSKGNLVEIIYPDATMPDGSVQSNCKAVLKYDNVGQLIDERSPEGRRKTYEYYQNGNGAGLVKKTTAHDNASPLVRLFEYDALGKVKRMIDGLGNDTLFEYNLIGQLVKTELPSVNGIRAVYKFEYNEDRKIAREFHPKGDYADSVLNGQFIVNEYFYNVASWLVEIRKYSNTASPQITKIQRDYFGNVIRLVNPIGQEFRNRYDDRNLILEEIMFSNTAFPLKTKYHYDRVGNLDKITYPDGTFETLKYDSFDRLVSQTNHIGVSKELSYSAVRDEITRAILKDSLGAVLQVNLFSFDERGRLVKSDNNGLIGQVFYDKDNLAVAEIDHKGSRTIVEYDGLGRMKVVTDPMGNRRRSSYDVNGNIISNSTESLLYSGNYFSSIQAVSYDERNRPIQTIDPLGNKVSFVYDDRNLKTGVVNALGQKVSMYYDINGQTIKTGLFKSGNEILINQWNRDLVGRLVSYQDAESNRTEYFYDERGYLVKTQYPDNSSITKQYDTFGLLEREIDCNGTISKFIYNAESQLNRVDFQVNGGVLQTPPLIYGYDSFGRNNSIARGTHTVFKKFDHFNRIIEEKQGAETIRKVFDDLSSSVATVFPDGRVDKYKLDKLGRVNEVVFLKKGTSNCLVNDFAEGTVLAVFEYEGLFLKRKKYANGVITAYNYDIEGRLSGWSAKDGSGTSVDGEQYLYDGEKRKRLIVRNGLLNTNRLFNYDELSRLVQSYTGTGIGSAIPGNLNDQASIDAFINGLNGGAAVGEERYSISDNDKRTNWSIDGVQYNTVYDTLLQLLSISGGANNSYTYDKNGNRISDNECRYYYDAFDNLVEVVRKSDNVTILKHAYDGEGRVIERTENNVSNKYYYDGIRSIQEKEQGGDTNQSTFGLSIDEYIVQSKGNSNYFFHQNGISSLNSVTDSRSTPVQYFDFSPFGSAAVFDGNKNPIPSSSSIVDILFSGRPYLESVGKYDFRKRLYDQQVGLFIQRDVYHYLDSANASLFCKHNPVSFTDPLGEAVPLIIGAFVLLGEGAAIKLTWDDAQENPQKYMGMQKGAGRVFGYSVAGAAVGGVAGAGGEAVLLLGGQGAFAAAGSTASLTTAQSFGLYGASSAVFGGIGRAGFNQLFSDQVDPVSVNSVATDFAAGGVLKIAFGAMTHLVNSGTPNFLTSFFGKDPGASRFQQWLRFMADRGGETSGAGVVTNLDKIKGLNPFAIMDTRVHENFHSLIARYLKPIRNLTDPRKFSIETVGRVKYMEEVIANTLGHLSSGRVHAVPFAPFEAFNSILQHPYFIQNGIAKPAVESAKGFWGRLGNAFGLGLAEQMTKDGKAAGHGDQKMSPSNKN